MEIQDFAMIMISLILSGISFAIMHKDMKEHKEDFKLTKFIIIYSVISAVVVAAIATTLQLKFVNNEFTFNLKRVCILAILWAVAYIDFESYRIPNEFIIFGLICRAIIIPFELLFVDGKVLGMILADIIAATALFAATALCKLLIKNSIGAGDIKLFIIMGLMLGLDGIWSSIFMSLIVSFFIALYLLISKKKSRKDSIPFGPAIAVGTFLSVFLGGM